MLTFRAPQLIVWFARAHSGLPLAGDSRRATALLYYRRESLVALAFALGTFALFALARFSRAPRRALESLAVVLVALELWTYGHALLRTLPASDLFAPPRVARDLPASAGRLFSDEPYRRDKTEIVLHRRQSASPLGARLDRAPRLAHRESLRLRLRARQGFRPLPHPAGGARAALLRADSRPPRARAPPARRLERLAFGRAQDDERVRRRGASAGRGSRVLGRPGAGAAERFRSAALSLRRARPDLPRGRRRRTRSDGGRPAAECGRVSDRASHEFFRRAAGTFDSAGPSRRRPPPQGRRSRRPCAPRLFGAGPGAPRRRFDLRRPLAGARRRARSADLRDRRGLHGAPRSRRRGRSLAALPRPVGEPRGGDHRGFDPRGASAGAALAPARSHRHPPLPAA